MRVSIENYIFDKSFKRTRNFVQRFCKSPQDSLVDIIYITGATSKGKTDLLHVFNNEVFIKNPCLKIQIIDTNCLVEHLLFLIKHDHSYELIDYYKHLDLLLLDNFETVNGKPKTIESLFSFFNQFTSMNKKIIISSLDKKLWFKLKTIKYPLRLREINLNKNQFELDRFIHLKSNLFGILDLDINPLSSDLREIEGLLNTNYFNKVTF
jgi:chromosomal replication initiation ATPase DnaA